MYCYAVQVYVGGQWIMHHTTPNQTEGKKLATSLRGNGRYERVRVVKLHSNGRTIR